MLHLRRLLGRRADLNISTEDLRLYGEDCREISRLLLDHGKKCAPYNDEEFSRLRQHPHSQRIMQNVRAYRDTLRAVAELGEASIDERKCLWHALKRLSLRPSADLMEHIRERETIQIYSTQNLLMYVNLEFFDHIVATVDEVFTIVWNEDSKRDMKVTLEALRLVLLVKTRQLRKTFVPHSIPAHTAEFTFSGVAQRIEVDLKLASPLFGESGMSAYLIAQVTKSAIAGA